MPVWSERNGEDGAPRAAAGMIDSVLLTRRWSLFLLAAGIFNWVIWPRFAVAIWQDPRAWSEVVGSSSPTTFLWVHAVLIVTAVAVSTLVGMLGVRGLLAARRTAGRRGLQRV